jgi:hypothetical protein
MVSLDCSEEHVEFLEELTDKLESEVSRLRARIAELETPVPKTFQHAIRRVVITEDCEGMGTGEVIYDAEDDDVGCVYIVTPEVMRAEIRPILEGLATGRFITEEQIDRAFDLARASNDRRDAGGTSIGLMVLAECGIVACEECGGSKIIGRATPHPCDCTGCHRNGKSHGWVWAEKS